MSRQCPTFGFWNVSGISDRRSRTTASSPSRCRLVGDICADHISRIFSHISAIFLHQVFDGNTDQNSLSTHQLAEHIIARKVRLHPRTWHRHISLRAEFYGCIPSGEETSIQLEIWPRMTSTIHLPVMIMTGQIYIPYHTVQAYWCH